MLVKWITCQVKKEEKAAFKKAQDAWSEVNKSPGFLGQAGGWNLDNPIEACVVSFWKDEEAYHYFMKNIHNNILNSNQQKTTYQKIHVQFAQVEKVPLVSNETEVTTFIQEHFGTALETVPTWTVISSNDINLAPYIPEYQQQLEKFELLEEQLAFTSLPGPALNICETDKGRHPVVILSGMEPAGFFVLYEGEEMPIYTSNEQAILLRAYSVSYPFQSRGIAKKSLKLLPEYVKRHFPHYNEVVLAVNLRNQAAQHVYQKAGFTDTGRTVMGRIGEQYIYSLAIN
jgi:RimJ/RimL family protein N-acetyltransferase/heme-degrading monooxygenase HmoA